MPSLTLDYVLTGQRRGYTLTADSAVPPDAQKAIWRTALPRGTGWDAPLYAGARALKCWPLDGRTAALAVTTITDLRDELGRGGIKRAHITYGGHAEIQHALTAELAALPTAIVARAEAALTSQAWGLLIKKHRADGGALKPQTILSAPYDPVRWPLIEACVLLLAVRATLLTNLIEVTPRVNPFADPLLSFTTLALTAHDETRLVALPADRAAGLPHIALTDLLAG